jgi:hypothetical protein
MVIYILSLYGSSLDLVYVTHEIGSRFLLDNQTRSSINSGEDRGQSTSSYLSFLHGYIQYWGVGDRVENWSIQKARENM